MTGDALLGLIERNGLPVVMAIGAVVLLWRFGGQVLGALLETQRERVSALESDRDHFRDRAEAADDRMNGLARELIDECRVRAKGADDGKLPDPDLQP